MAIRPITGNARHTGATDQPDIPARNANVTQDVIAEGVKLALGMAHAAAMAPRLDKAEHLRPLVEMTGF
jgi:hypothetical protein